MFLSFLLLPLNLPFPVYACGSDGNPGNENSCHDYLDGDSDDADGDGGSNSNHIIMPSGNLNLTVPLFSLKTKDAPISLSLTYNSQGEKSNGPFGYGWLFSYDARIDLYNAANDVRLIRLHASGDVSTFTQFSDDEFRNGDQRLRVIYLNPDGTATEELTNGRRYVFDSDGRLKQVIGRRGRANIINRDEDGFITSIIDPADREIQFVRSGAKIVKIIAPDGGAYNFNYSLGRLVSISTPEEEVTTFSYDSAYRMTQKDTSGRTVDYQYDDEGRVSARTNENLHTTHFVYDVENSRTTVIAPSGNYQVISYDQASRWTHQQWFDKYDTLVKEEWAEYGADGNIVLQEDGERNQTIYTYDDYGNLDGRKEASGHWLHWEYDTDHNLVKEIDARGNGVEYDYDDFGNRSQATWYINSDPVSESWTSYTTGHPNAGLIASHTDARGFTTTYEYDQYGNRTRIAQPLGAEITFTYDVMGRMKTRTEKVDENTFVTTSYTYDHDGRQTRIDYHDGSYEEFEYDCCVLKKKRDRNGNWVEYTYSGTHKPLSEQRGDRLTEYEYDQDDNLVRIIVRNNPFNNRVVEMDYDAAGRVIEERKLGAEMNLVVHNDYNGADKIVLSKRKLGEDWITTTYVYDEMNRLKAVHAPLESSTFYGYDENGNWVSATDAEGRNTSYAYDERNRLKSITNDLDVVTEYVLDENGNRVAMIEAAGTDLERITEYDHDELNRLTKITDPLTKETVFTYDLTDNMSSRTDANGNTTSFTYDSNKKLVSQTNAEGHTISYEYDCNGNRTKLIDPLENETVFAYNQFNEVVSVTYPDESVESYVYDKAGNKISMTNRAGQVIAFDYDDHNRLVKKTYPDESETTFAYDQLGRMTQASNAIATYQFAYNDLHQLQEYYFTVGQEQYSIAYQWDKVGNKTEITYPGNVVYSRIYDDLNRLDQVKDAAENVLADYNYDELNRRVRLDYLNTAWTTHTYNAADGLTDLANWRTETAMTSFFAYTHDDIGNRLSMTTLDGAHSYGYDDVYQLASVDYPGSYPFSSTTYYYDAAFNRTTTINGGEVGYAINTLNQYTTVGGTSLSYDLSGNLIDDGVQRYYYDVENKLTSVRRNSDSQTLGEYGYDPFGRRIIKTAGGTTTHYIYDHLSYQVIAEYEDCGQGFSQARRFVYGVGIDEPVVMETAQGRIFYHRDGLGSVVNLTDETGATTATYRYDVYGSFQLNGTSHGNPFAFTGRRYDPESGLYFYRARYYSPEIGRFLQADLRGYVDGPNLYTYVLNSPTKYIDPSGNTPILPIICLIYYITKCLFYSGQIMEIGMRCQEELISLAAEYGNEIAIVMFIGKYGGGARDDALYNCTRINAVDKFGDWISNCFGVAY